MPSKLEPYEPLRPITRDIWCVDGSWGSGPFERRMTVIRLRDGRLVLHSAIAMNDADVAELLKLGEIGTLVIPNTLHGSEAGFYADRFPGARVYAPQNLQKGLRKKYADRVFQPGSLEEDWPTAWADELPVLPIQGTRVREAALFHAPSRTLILTDLAFNYEPGDLAAKAGVGIEKIMRWNRIGRGFGPSRLFEWVFVSDRAALARSLRKILDWDFDRIIVGHGRVVETDGKEVFSRAFGRWIG